MRCVKAKCAVNIMMDLGGHVHLFIWAMCFCLRAHYLMNFTIFNVSSCNFVLKVHSYKTSVINVRHMIMTTLVTSVTMDDFKSSVSFHKCMNWRYRKSCNWSHSIVR